MKRSVATGELDCYDFVGGDWFIDGDDDRQQLEST